MTDKLASKGGRRRTGSLEAAQTFEDGSPRFRFRVRLGDGSKSERFDVPRGLNEDKARAHVAAMQAFEDAHGKLLAKKREVSRKAAIVAAPKVATDEMDRWFDAWEKSRKARGLTATADNRSHYYGYIAEDFGGEHVRDWTAEDVRVHVRALDARVQGGLLAWKTTINVYATTRKMCADAMRSKLDALRVRTDDPTSGAEGPDHGDEKSKPFLYPSEFLRFIGCPDVPVRWRLAVTLAIYLFPRDGELRVLSWEDGDVDLEHGTVHIHKAWDRRARAVKSTKTGASRRFNIEPALLALLRELRNAGASGPLVSMASEPSMARGLREWLAKAGVTRPELHTGTKTTKKLTWHDLRATGLTWMAVRGDDPLKIMQRAGHTHFGTTQIYIRTAEALRDGFGELFPTLPYGAFGPPERPSRAELPRMTVGQPGLESGEPASIDQLPQTSEDNAPSEASGSARHHVDTELSGPAFGPVSDVETALARALESAAAAGRFDVVAQLASELEARRLARSSNVVALHASRARRR